MSRILSTSLMKIYIRLVKILILSLQLSQHTIDIGENKISQNPETLLNLANKETRRLRRRIEEKKCACWKKCVFNFPLVYTHFEKDIYYSYLVIFQNSFDFFVRLTENLKSCNYMKLTKIV